LFQVSAVRSEFHYGYLAREREWDCWFDGGIANEDIVIISTMTKKITRMMMGIRRWKMRLRYRRFPGDW
jgi:hypothetical protein